MLLFVRLFDCKAFFRFLFYPLLVFAVFASCVDTESEIEKRQNTDDAKIQKYLNDNHYKAEKDLNGYYYQVLKQDSTGEILEQNDIVSFYYTIRLLDGKIIGGVNKNSPMPARFLLNYYSIVPEGLLYGISQMRIGEKYRFYLPSWLAYGEFSNSDISSYSNFIIDITTLSKINEDTLINEQIDSIQNYIHDNELELEKDEDGLFYYHELEGEGEYPTESSQVTFNFTRRYLDSTIITTTINSGPVTLTLGANQAVTGLEKGILKMKKGGKCIMIMPENLAFKQAICVIPVTLQTDLFEQGYILTNVTPYSIVMYEVELLDFQ